MAWLWLDRLRMNAMKSRTSWGWTKTTSDGTVNLNSSIMITEDKVETIEP